MKAKLEPPTIVLAGFAESNYPEDLIQRKFSEARELLEKNGIRILHQELFNEVMKEEEIARACERMAKESFDLLVACVIAWVPSNVVVRVVDEFSHKPILLWGLTGDMVNGKLVTPAAQAGTTALRKTMEDLGYKFKYVYEYLHQPPKVDQVTNFARAARAARLLRRSKVGMMGYRDMSLYSTMFDEISLRKKVGVEVEFFEMLEMVQKMDSVNEEEVMKIVDEIKRQWTFEKEPPDTFLEKGAKIYLALKDIIQDRGYQAISLKDVEGMRKLLNFPPAMVFMLLTDKLGVCTIPENDVLGAVTQLMVRYLTGQAAAYMEVYEFMKDRVLFGTCDYVPSEIVDGPVKATFTAFGHLGGGIINVSKVKTGKVTLCRLSNYGEKYVMHVVTGEALKPMKWEEAGWAPVAPELPSIEVKLDSPVEDFADKVLSQHYILSYGDNTGVIKDLCKLLDIEII